MQDLGSQPLERIVEIPVSVPLVYTLPLPYSLQPRSNILLHFISIAWQAFSWNAIAGLLT